MGSNAWCAYCAQGVGCWDDSCPVRAQRARDRRENRATDEAYRGVVGAEYSRPNTGNHPDHPPVDGGYRGATVSHTGCGCDETIGFKHFADGSSEAECRKCGHAWLLPSPSPVHHPASVIAEATLADAVRVDLPAHLRERNEKFAADVAKRADDLGGTYARGGINDPRLNGAAAVFLARTLPTPSEDADRKAIPVWSGCVRYFPSALLEVAKVSKAGNDQHNPGQPLHWAQGKSMNQTDTCARHLLDADACEGTAEEIPHLAQAAWRMLARLQLACQREGAPLAPGARAPEVAK